MVVEIFFMTKSPRKNVFPGVRIKLASVRMPGGHVSDRATAPSLSMMCDVSFTNNNSNIHC